MRSGTWREGGRERGIRDACSRFAPVLQLRGSAFPPSVPVISRPLSKLVQLYLSAGFSRRAVCQIKSFPALWKLLWEWGNFGSCQVWAYLKLMLHLHATLSLPHPLPFWLAEAFLSSYPGLAFPRSLSFGAPSFDELNIAATLKFMSWKSADVWSRVRSVILCPAIE